MMNICFVANYALTKLYSEIAKRLNANIYWIVVSDDIHNDLLEDFDNNKILRIKYLKKEIPTYESLDIVYNDIVLGDRRLKFNPSNGKNYLKRISREIFEFLTFNQIEIVFGEVTWAHEIIVHRVQTQLRSRNYLIPHDVREPKGKFTFFKDEFWSIQYDCKKPFSQVKDEHKQSENCSQSNHILVTDSFINRRNSFQYF
jgi:hypothetical protein